MKFAIFTVAILGFQFSAFADQKKPDVRKPASAAYYCEERTKLDYKVSRDDKMVPPTLEERLNTVCNPSLPFSVTKMNQTEFSFCCIAK